jgi:hypothetical protein
MDRCASDAARYKEGCSAMMLRIMPDFLVIKTSLASPKLGAKIYGSSHVSPTRPPSFFIYYSTTQQLLILYSSQMAGKQPDRRGVCSKAPISNIWGWEGAVFDRNIGRDHMTTRCKGCRKQRQRPLKTASYVPESRVVL